MRAWAAGCRLKGRSGVMRGAPQPRARVQSTCGDGRRISVALDAYRGTRVRRCAPRLQHVVAEVAAELQRGVEGRFRRRFVLRRPTARQRCTASAVRMCGDAGADGHAPSALSSAARCRSSDQAAGARAAAVRPAQHQRPVGATGGAHGARNAVQRTASPGVAVCAARRAALPPQRLAPRPTAASIAALCLRARARR
jgi:hypothetical protein